MDFRKRILARVKLAGGCDSCEMLTVNGVPTHEHGCPKAWMNRKKKCFECGFDFVPENRFDSVCQDCKESIENPEAFASWRSYLTKKAEGEQIIPEPRQKIPFEVWTNSKKSDGTPYELWEKRIDKLVSKKYGMSVHDFEDWMSMDAYDKNKTVMQGFKSFQTQMKKYHGDLV